eukprot:TRINITY_DN3624_c0_g1_i2.p1 TRINITY_DN3624_c0_g1~~TRINITY_DN3624_c0_g1_i2.p1  ORF type:complete len:213 (+),score=43.48 TRINITY_DN3624_c0_g1_i2:62-700(+)
MTIHDVLLEAFSHVTVDDSIMKYIEEILEESASMQFSVVKDSLSDLLISLDVAKNHREADAVLTSILLKMNTPDADVDVSTSEDMLNETPAKVVSGTTRKKSDEYLTPEEVIKLTHDPNPKVRRSALREMCPCHVKANISSLWERIIEMSHDPDAKVRYQVMHNLCDGSPASREYDVIRTLEGMHNDEDKVVRRRVHQILTHYRYTGKWNIM